MDIETKETTVRRIRVTGPRDEGGQVMNQLRVGGWRIKRSGPYTDEEMHPEVEVDRFLIVAEKESDSPPSGALESYVRVPREKLDQWIKTTISMSDAYDDDAFGRMQDLNYDLNEDMREVLSEHAT